MVASRFTTERHCAGCGLVFRWRNDLDQTWRDMNYCSSGCQRRAGIRASQRAQDERKSRFPKAFRFFDCSR